MATTFTAAQQKLIDDAVARSFAGIGAGNSVAGFSTVFTTALRQDKGSNPNGLAFTDAQISQLQTAYQGVDSHGAGFREQGGSAQPFVATWEARLHQLFPTAAAPIAAPTPAATPSPISIPVITTQPVAIAKPTEAPTPAAVTTPAQAATNAVTQTQAIIAALTTALAPAAAPAAAPVAAPVAAATTTTATALQAATPADATTTTGASASDFANALLGAAGNATVPGSGSVAGGYGVADAGQTGLTQSPTTSTGPDLTLVLLVLGLVGVGGFFWWRSQHHAKPAATPPGGH